MSVDWSKIRLKLRALERDLRGVVLLDYADLEAYRLHRLTYGQVSAPRWRGISHGTAMYIHAVGDKVVRDAWSGLATELGWTHTSTLPKHIPPRHGGVDHFQVIESAISNEQVSQEFLDSWARLHAAHARFHALAIQPDASGVVVDKIISGAMTGVEVQEHWYAHWLNRAGALSSKKRVDAGQELAILCYDVVRGTVCPPQPYPRDWFGKLLAVDPKSKERSDDLTTNLQKLGVPKLKAMILHPILQPNVLPPLTREEFETATP